ncbi:MAG TPA: VanZ family protein [Pirellulales bacterium]|nr:VanZ family protein [Pirellulales bacterium]
MILSTFQGPNGSARRAQLRRALRWLVGYCALLIALTHWPNPWPQRREPHHLDKIAHFSLYTVLAALGLHALTVRSKGSSPRQALVVAAVATAFGLLDETTQPLVRRDFDWFDWLADGAGALTGVIAYNAWRLRGASRPKDGTPMASFKQLTDFLVSLGTDKVPHTNEVFLAHLIGVYRDLESWGCDDDLCCAGMFHSIYGTERFQRFSLSLARRGEVRDLIGPRAERLAYVNCVMDRASFDRAALDDGDNYRVVDRLSGEPISLTRDEFDDLCRVHLCDWLEQVPRSKEWDYRRPAYRRLAERLGGAAQEAYDRVFAMETAGNAVN